MLSIAQRSCADRAAGSIPLSGEEWACIGRLRDVVALIVLLVCYYSVEKSGLLVDYRIPVPPRIRHHTTFCVHVLSPQEVASSQQRDHATLLSSACLYKNTV
jgi:hypothetical protein